MQSVEGCAPSNTTARLKDWQIFLPDRGAWFFVYLMGAFLFARPLLLLWDGGTCRHFYNGLYMLQHHAIPMTDYTWAIDPGLPCMTRCWLGDLISGTFYNFFKLNGLVFTHSLAVVVGLVWSYQVSRAKGLGLMSGLLGMVITMACVSMHWSARCHLYSYLPIIALYYYVFVVEKRTWKTVALVALTMALWSNLHGSSMIGLIVLGASFAGNVIDRLRFGKKREKGDASAQSKADRALLFLKYDLAMIFASLATTCINPRGVSLYTTVFTYLSNPVVIHKTDEWKAFDIFGGIGSVAFLILLGIMIWLTVVARKLPPTGEILLSGALIVAGFDAMRMIPYYALIACAIVGPAWLALKERRACEVAAQPAEQSTDPAVSPAAQAAARDKSLKPLPKWLDKMLDMEAKAEPDEKTNLKLTVGSIAAVALMGAVFLTVPFFHVEDFDAERMPVKAVDYLLDHGIEGVGYNYDNWGGYIYYRGERVGDKRLVFIDDWTDFLPVKFVDDYLDILLAQNDWRKNFDSHNFPWVLVPKASPLSQILSQDKSWKTVYADEENVLMVRADQAEPAESK